jgi:uncharacterized membrane protein
MSEQAKNHSNYTVGIILILLGVFFLCVQLDLVNWDNFWPIILIVGGLLFYLGFLVNRRNFGLLMPGTILLVIGVLFFYTNRGYWNRMDELWPTFVIAPGLGFILMYIFGPKGNALWIPATVLIVLACLFYGRLWGIFRYWPVILIAVGLYLLVRGLNLPKEPAGKDRADFTEK